MSIIKSNRNQAAIPFRISVPRSPELSKREMREMLAEAVRNTAAAADDSEDSTAHPDQLAREGT